MDPAPKLKLVEDKDAPRKAEARLVPLSEILVVTSDNVRDEYNPDSINSLATSLQTKGQLQSLLLQHLNEPGPNGERYKLVAGYRRYLAAQQAGVTELFAIIKDYEEPELAAAANAAENLEREDVPLYDYLKRIKSLLDAGWDAQRIIRETGMRDDVCERLAELVTEVAPELLAKLRHDESAWMIQRLQWVANNIKGYDQQHKFEKQVEWWSREGWKDWNKKKPHKAKSAPPEKIADLAERIRAARGIQDTKGGFVKLSPEQADAVCSALLWCAFPKNRKMPL